MAAVNQIKSYDALLWSLDTYFAKAEFIKSHYLLFEGKVLYFKINTQNQAKFFHFYITNVGFKLEVFNKESKHLIDTIIYNFNNSTDTSINTIFVKKMLPIMIDVAKSATPKPEQKSE
jgi:hypothetical protein